MWRATGGMFGAMTDSAGNEPPMLPAPPDMPDGVALATADAPGDTSPPEHTGGAPRWLSEVALPFALGLLCAASWVGAVILAVWDGLSFAELRASQAALLLVIPLGVVVVAVARSADDWRASESGQVGGALRLLLTMAVIVLGLAFAFLATAPLPPDNNAGIVFALPFAAPGFSVGVALGFAYGARPRPTGAGVGLMGGLGFATPLVALAVALIVMSHQPPTGCDIPRNACGLAAAIDQIFALFLFAACVLTNILSFIGGILGAFLRRRASAES